MEDGVEQTEEVEEEEVDSRVLVGDEGMYEPIVALGRLEENEVPVKKNKKTNMKSEAGEGRWKEVG